MSTRISLSTGGTIIVAETCEQVRRMLSLDANAPPVVFHPSHQFDADLRPVDPEPIALRVEHVSMIASADPEPGQLSSALDLRTMRRVARKMRDQQT